MVTSKGNKLYRVRGRFTESRFFKTLRPARLMAARYRRVKVYDVRIEKHFAVETINPRECTNEQHWQLCANGEGFRETSY